MKRDPGKSIQESLREASGEEETRKVLYFALASYKDASARTRRKWCRIVVEKGYSLVYDREGRLLA